MLERVRVVLVEDSDVYRDSLVFLLGRDDRLEVVAAVADGTSAGPVCGEHGPDVVVVDYRLPDMDGLEVAAAVQRHAPGVAVVFLSASAGEAEYDAARRTGAPLVRKDDGIGAVVEAIVTAAGRADV